jgi:hypothetical protein
MLLGRAGHGRWPDGPRRADGWAGVDAGRAFGLVPGRKVLFFFEFIFNAKTIPENLEIV